MFHVYPGSFPRTFAKHTRSIYVPLLSSNVVPILKNSGLPYYMSAFPVYGY